MGRSQGAKMAAQFVHKNPGVTDKLILLGTTHRRDIGLSKAEIPILKISGSNDGVADLEKGNQNIPRLPPLTRYVVIENNLQDLVRKAVLHLSAQEILEDLKTIDLQSDPEWQAARHLAWEQEKHRYILSQ